MGTIMLVLIGATILEQFFGTDFVVRYIYTAPWTIALWAAAVVAGGWYILRCLRCHTMRWSVIGIHFSFVVILAGSLVTHLWGDAGSLHLRLHQPTTTYLHEDDKRELLPFTVTLSDTRFFFIFPIIPYPHVGGCNLSLTMVECQQGCSLELVSKNHELFLAREW